MVMVKQYKQTNVTMNSKVLVTKLAQG